ncbi:glycosyl hydrolase [Neptunitalea chrysea]|uniref:Glycosyl hydrolase n=1 Tax=Neptunitalea chrysea TaxID=1647581 RepID=A0A9W6B3N8_9FLAO|nr:glycoside hydrolase family 25 protein [Neptunitalea chrysea]GLB52066.1 glycosyl hydrolase [Neptunitalea chrysea]
MAGGKGKDKEHPLKPLGVTPKKDIAKRETKTNTAAKNAVKKRTPQKRNTTKKKKTERRFSFGKHIIFPIFLIAFLYGLWHYRYALYYFIEKKVEKRYEISLTDEMRIYDVLNRHNNHLYGLDISHYQGSIDWSESLKIQDSFPVSFVFVRATAGKDLEDRKFKENWKALKEHGIMKGAYHYYRPNENSIQQAINFINTVSLKKGDLPPVLDIENVPSTQSIDSLKLGLRRWLNRVENHYKVKPIIYSGEDFYNRFLYEDFEEYTIWIANYNFFVERIEPDWHFWQFTDKATVPGCREPVDVNVFNGDSLKLKKLILK